MNNSIFTLADFFVQDRKNLCRQLQEGFGSSEESNSINAQLVQKLAAFPLAALRNEIAAKLQESLDIPLSTILMRAWNQARELEKALDSTRQSDETVLLPLFDHTIDSTHQPYVEILRNNKPITKIAFAVDLRFILEGIVLRIKKGEIREVLAGKIKMSGTVKFHDFVIIEKDFEPIQVRFAESTPDKTNADTLNEEATA